MAHFAEIDENNIVQQVIVVHNNELEDEGGNEVEQNGIDFCETLFGHPNWVQCSYNNNIRKQFAGTGFTTLSSTGGGHGQAGDGGSGGGA